MFSLSNFNKRKYSIIFAKIALFAFVFAWVTCTSHISLISHISDPQTSEHSPHKEDSPLVHNETCVDHTQVSARNQGGDYHNDFSLALLFIESPDFSFNIVSQEVTYLPIIEFDSGQRLFLENKVLRL